jgi:cytochrome c5
MVLAGCGHADSHAPLLAELRGSAAEREPGADFRVAARTPHLEQYPCSRCHEQPVAVSADKKKAHWRIELRHASRETMTCETCHAGGSRESLR